MTNDELEITNWKLPPENYQVVILNLFQNPIDKVHCQFGLRAKNCHPEPIETQTPRLNKKKVIFSDHLYMILRKTLFSFLSFLLHFHHIL